MSVRTTTTNSQISLSHNPFIDPHLKENNPYRGSTRSRSSSVHTPHLTPPSQRPSHRRASSNPHITSPLAQIRLETRQSNNPRHLKKSSIPGADSIDRLGAVLTPYHHGGPYDATLAARQIPGYAPVDAVRESNEAAIRATPRANIVDSLERHVPMQGTAVFPPGVGGLGEYEEVDVMREGSGGVGRWAHLEYHPEDLEGKGEPSYSIEEAEKRKKVEMKEYVDATGYEMQTKGHQRGSSLTVPTASGMEGSGRKRSTSLGGRLRRKLESFR